MPPLSSRASEATRDLLLILNALKTEIPPAPPYGMTKLERDPSRSLGMTNRRDPSAKKLRPRDDNLLSSRTERSDGGTCP